MPTPLPGPDGYLLSPDDLLHAAQLRLSDYLFAEEQRDPGAPFDVAVWRKLPKRLVPDQVAALLLRLAWLDQHDAELPNAHLARMRLTTLLRVLYKFKAPYTEADLCRLLDLTVPFLGRIAPYGPVECVVEYVKGNDLTVGLCASLRRFQSSLQGEMSSGQAAMQYLRQQLHMLLWLDEWEPLDPARCWSECVRRDFRGFGGERQAKWRLLLKHLRGNAPVRMPAGWAREAGPLLEAVGIEDFREQIHVWFAPFRSGQPLPLSVAGSYAIKGLIWFCVVARDKNLDDDLKDCCLWLLDAKWKQKRNTEKVMVALSEFGIGKEELIARNLIKPLPSPQSLGLLEKLQKAVVLMPANHIQMDPDGELIVVQGQLHFYRLFRSSGRMERVSDGAVLELNWPAIPDQFRLFLHRECDSPEQLSLRAHLLMQDGIFGDYFVRKGEKP